MLKKKNVKDFNVSLSELKETDPKMLVLFQMKYPKHMKYWDLKPKSRIAKVDSIFKCNFKELQKIIGSKGERVGSESRPSGLRCELKFSKIQSLDYGKLVEWINVEKIDGYKKHMQKKGKQFFSVKVKIAIQIEGIKKGKQLLEERIIVVKAKSTKSAEKKVVKGLKRESKQYLNSDGRLVRWKFDKILDIYETGLYDSKEFNYKLGSEVSSVLKKKKINLKNVYSKKWKN